MKLSCFKRELLRLFFEEIKHPKYASVITKKVLYYAINSESKKLCCINGILKNERVPELYGSHLDGDTRIVFHAKNADTIDPDNFVVRVNDSDIAVILICNIHHMDSDVWYNSGHNYDNSKKCVNIKKLVTTIQNISSLPSLYAFLGNGYTPTFFGKGKVKPIQIAIKKRTITQGI